MKNKKYFLILGLLILAIAFTFLVLSVSFVATHWNDPTEDRPVPATTPTQWRS